jgi:hypothetical protein
MTVREYRLAESLPLGLTYGQWTVRWWRWALSIPKPVNPVLDESGKYASMGQPENSVWFLSGRFGNERNDFPKRCCTVPLNRSILFPVINYEANLLECPQLNSKEELIEHVRRAEDTILNRECFVDGIAVAPQRVRSDPQVFELKIGKKNPVGFKRFGNTFASADGYWVFLKPLGIGDHSISFEGSCEQGKLRSGASYQLHIRDPDTESS